MMKKLEIKGSFALGPHSRNRDGGISCDGSLVDYI